MRKTRLIPLVPILILAVFAGGSFALGSASHLFNSDADVYRVVVDQKGQMRLLTPDGRGRDDDDLKPNESVIEIPSRDLVTAQQNKIAELERRIVALENRANSTGGPVINDASLALYLPLYALDGNVFTSNDSYHHTMTVTGAVRGSQGRIFDGLDDVITSPVVLPANTSPGMTVMAWVSKADLNSRRFICSSGYAPWQFEVWSNNSIGLEVNIDGVYRHLVTGPNKYPSDNASHLVVFSHDLASGYWYIAVDGQITGSGTQTGAVYAGGGTLRIGDHNGVGGSYWKGSIGEIEIYSRALTPLEMQLSYLGTRTRYQ